MSARAALLLTVLVGARAFADPAPQSPAARDPPRWRLRATVAQGFGGGAGSDGPVARFPTIAEIGARLWGPLSLDAAFTGTVAGEYAATCGQAVRPSAVAGSVGLRADLANGRSAPWADPWVEVHGGIGAQAAAHDVVGGCPAAATFGPAGARAGLDVWLGRGAVTVAVAVDYLPVGTSVSFVLGGSVVVF